ncbi:Uncharacterised protein [Bordetella pertussis]|nr:Uncharacterised protein [Bordetella pertussis]CPK74849.1 Uncharacterised protein [Bordetella pertussis]CPM50946.1 Uncharacterised protein [Bordetella pertussis]
MYCLTMRVPVTAMFLISSRLMLNTILRKAGAQALYRWIMACLAPAAASTVRLMRSSRDWVRTMMVTSSGMRFSSISLRTKSKSVCDADGKPTSISLKPIFTSCSKKRTLRSTLMGSISDWLPSRKSVLIQMGGWVMRRLGQVRSAKSRAKGWNGTYLVAGLASIISTPRSVSCESRRASGNDVGHGDGRAWGWPTALRWSFRGQFGRKSAGFSLIKRGKTRVASVRLPSYHGALGPATDR